MRKPKYEFGNVGAPTGREDVHRRCNCCNFLAGVDGTRQMTKDKNDPTGGYICSVCQSGGLISYSQEEEEWAEAIKASKNTVDGERNYDEMIEDLITEWEKSQDR